MPNEALIATSSYVEIIPSAAVATSSWSADSEALNATGNVTDANEQLYLLIDFQILVTAETFADGDTLDIYRIPSDGTNEASSPDDYTTGAPHYIGSVSADAASSTLYFFGAKNYHPTDKFKVLNNSASSVTFSVNARTRSSGTAA